jgi:hypothetical protein
MQTTNSWGTRSISWWLTFLVALGIIFIGARFIINPTAGAMGYGIPFASEHDFPYARIKGIRDIFSGIALLPLLFLRMRSATAWVLTTAIIIPATDFMIVLSTNGASDVQHLMIHGLTVVYMAITSILLYRKR